MANLDVSQVKSALGEIKRKRYLMKSRPSEYVREHNDAFRRGIENRRKAREMLGALVSPPAIAYTSLDTAFLIWPSRIGSAGSSGDDTPPQFSLFESHEQPLNNYAQFAVDSEFGSTFFVGDYVSFYFMWQNETGTDAVLNAETFLSLLNGFCMVRAKQGWLWAPFWNASNTGSCRMVVTAQLSLLEWWNQPPTEPLWQAGQSEVAADLSVSGGFIIVNVGENFKGETVQSSHHLHYDQFFVPRGGVTVFEVSLLLNYSGYKGGFDVSFAPPDRQIICPSVALEILTPSSAPVIHG